MTTTTNPNGDNEMKYKVTNIYDISGESTHSTAELALKAADKREGAGWIVRDDEGNQYDWNGTTAVISVHKVI